MTAVIDVIYTRKALGHPPGTDGYVNSIKIDAETAPDELEKCLIFTGNGTPEAYNRVADLADIANTSISDSPPPLNIFSSATWGPFQVGDIITIYVRPPIWENAGMIPNKTYTVTSTVGSAGQIDEFFPSFEENVYFTAVRVGMPPPPNVVYTDGIATRDYTGFPGTEFRVSEYTTWFQDKVDAETELTGIKTGLQDLADEYNLDYYEQDEWEIYTGDLGSRIRIHFVTAQLPPLTADEFYIFIEIDTGYTTADLTDCLVFRRELGSERETLVRGATLDDLINLSNSPPSLTEFRSDYFLELPGNTVQTGDVIDIVSPLSPLWDYIDAPVSFIVGTAVSTPTIAPVTGIPVYENRHNFTVTRTPNTYPSSGNYTQGVSGRNVDTSVLYYRTNIYQTVITSLSEAINLVDSLKGQVASLVMAYDFDDFSGVETEVYT